jgi:hypothetical protein
VRKSYKNFVVNKNIIYSKDDFSNTDTFVTFCGNRYRWVYDCKQERG